MASHDEESTQAFSSGQLEVDLHELITWLESGEQQVADEPMFKPEYARVFVQALRRRYHLRASSIPPGSPAARINANVLAISQSAQSVGYELSLPKEQDDPGIQIELLFDPCSDSITLVNSSDRHLLQLAGSDAVVATVLPSKTHEIIPGSWVVSVRVGTVDMPTLRLQVQPRNYWAAEAIVQGAKRQIDRQAEGSKRRKGASSATDEPARSVTAGDHLLLTLAEGQTAYLVGQGAEETYAITRSRYLTSTRSARLYLATHSGISDEPIVVKVIKSIAGEPSRSAEVWLREATIHAQVDRHPSIIRFFGCDARFRSLYIEHEDAVALAERPWHGDAGMCTCDATAARAILQDIGHALHYLHGRGIMHNDVKPANILYRRSRGAVLIDFGMGSNAQEAVHSGGSPWYLPPEYLGSNIRGQPADVFALGVTMLWVMGKCRLPETSETWQIRYIHSHKATELSARQMARRSMEGWLAKLEAITASVSYADQTVAETVQGMLAKRESRVSAAEITRRLNDRACEPN